MITMWAACKADAAGIIISSERVVGVTVTGVGVYEVELENALGVDEVSAVAVPWYVAPGAVPLVRFVSGIDGASPNKIIVNGFAGNPPVPSAGPFDLIVWRTI